jgi:hypothetical protein
MPVCHAHLAEPVEMSSSESHPPRCSASHAGAKCAVGGGTNWATASAPGQEFQYSATAQGRLANAEAFTQLVIRTEPNGSLL